MTEITRTVERLVADVDVDDDGYVRIHVAEPLTVDEARDVAAAILVAAEEGARYLAEEGAATPAPDLGPRCSICRGEVIRDEHSTHGWRHVQPARGAVRHTARVDGEAA